ncbi:MAG TPA: PilZ domain-containing protein [Polyangiaceae bacterium]|nr:PilZ domain-containing protein [Polyangiaceae bacterium]
MLGTLVPAHQRRAVRRAIRVQCRVVRERDSRFIGSSGLDLSPLGMLVMGHHTALTGEPVLVSFRFPRSKSWFGVSATIARVIHGRRPSDIGRCFALEFDPLGSDMQRRLRAMLHGVPPPLPNREPRIDYAASVHLAALS